MWDIHRLFFISAKPVWTLGYAKQCQSAACSSLQIWQRQIIYQMGLETTLLLPSSLIFCARKHPLRQCFTLGQILMQCRRPFPTGKMKPQWFTHQWGNLALNVKIHAGIQPLTNTLRLEGTKYWSGPTSAGKQMRWTSSFFAVSITLTLGCTCRELWGCFSLCMKEQQLGIAKSWYSFAMSYSQPYANQETLTMLKRSPAGETVVCPLHPTGHLSGWRHGWVQGELLSQFIQER